MVAAALGEQLTAAVLRVSPGILRNRAHVARCGTVFIAQSQCMNVQLYISHSIAAIIVVLAGMNEAQSGMPS